MLKNIVYQPSIYCNLTIIDLIGLNEDNYKKSQRYLGYINIINSYYHFIEIINHIEKLLS